MKYILTESVKHFKMTSVAIERWRFPEQEIYVRIKENIRGKEVAIIGTVLPDNLLELLHDALEREYEKL